MDGWRGAAGSLHANGLLREHDARLPDSNRTLVEATSERTSEGWETNRVGAEVDAGRKSRLDAKPVPSTPSTACESTYSTVTPASSSSGLASSVWSQSSGGKTPQSSPASSTLSTATELDEGSTQLEPRTEDQVGASVPVAVECSGNGLENQGWGRSAASYGVGTPESSDPQSCGAKRLREKTSSAPQSHHVQDDSSPRPNPVGNNGQRLDEKFPQALPSDFGSPRRKKECSQYPRLDAHPTPGVGRKSHRNQLSNSVIEKSMSCVQGGAHGRIFNGVVAPPEILGGKRPRQENDERAEAKVKVAGNGNDGPEQAMTKNLQAQEVLDTCGGALAPRSSRCQTDQSDGDEVDFDGAERASVASSDSHDGAISSGAEQSSPGKISDFFCGGGHSKQLRSDELLPAVTCENRDGLCNEHSTDRQVVADAKDDEASALRDAGVTGDEEFNELFAKLRHGLKWKWGGLIDNLSNEYWMLKAGVKSKTAKVGVDKFAKGEDVVKYIRGVLRLADTTSDKQDKQSGEDRGQDTEGEEDDNRDGDKRDNNQAQGDIEKTTTSSKQLWPSASTPKVRALQAALEALNPSNAPGLLQQRTAEFNQVLRFVTNSVVRASGGSLYLCGVPGTGKTQTMAHVQAEVLKMYADGKIPAPGFHAFTGTEFTTPEAMHSALWLAVTGNNEVEEGINIEKKLSAKLKYRQKTPTVTSPMLVVVLDEIDQLLTQNRQVLRKLFEWADAPKSRLVLVGLANSLDFDINLSDLEKAPQRLLFQSYTPEDLASILTERVGMTVHHSAIQFCAKKAAATTGDARRAINMCREAVVLAKQEFQDKLDRAASEEERKQLRQGDGSSLVTIKHMAKAVAAGNAAKYAGAIAGLSFYAKIVLAVAAAAVEDVAGRARGGRANNGKCVRLTQGGLQERCTDAWRRLQTGGGPSQVEFTGIIDLLAASGLLALKSKQRTGGRARELVLRIEFADLEAALGDQPFFKTVTGV